MYGGCQETEKTRLGVLRSSTISSCSGSNTLTRLLARVLDVLKGGALCALGGACVGVLVEEATFVHSIKHTHTHIIICLYKVYFSLQSQNITYSQNSLSLYIYYYYYYYIVMPEFSEFIGASNSNS